MKALHLLGVMLLASGAFSSEWKYVSNVDVFEDVDTSYIFAEGTPMSGIPSYSTPYLILRCNSAEPTGLNLFIGMNTYLNNDAIQVRWRLDKDEPSRYHWWDESTDGDAAFARNVETPTLIDGFKAKNEVIIEALDYNKSPHVVKFSLAGFTAAYNQFECPINEDAIN